MIKELKNDILRDIANPVGEITNEIKTLLNDMLETMEVNRGVGLAAPQIGVALRLVVIGFEGKAYKLINPKIIGNQGKQNSEEGCLSLGDKRGRVFRPEKVIVKALNENGEEIEIIGKGPLACILSHEIDHLDGILFTDKLRKF